MKYLILIRTVLSLIPLLIEAIKIVEEALPGTGKGEIKLAMIREILESSYKQAEDATIDFQALWPALAGAVGAVVKAYNATGEFK